jgi:hypothetical protein
MGTTQLLSVPYALYANSAGNSQATTPSLASVLAVNNGANNLQIKNIADPTDAQDAVTKSYSETQLQAQVTQLQAQITDLINATPSPVGSFNISSITSSNLGVSLAWTPMTYSTQSEVTYTIEVAPNGSDFSNAQAIGFTTDLFFTIQPDVLNLAAINAGVTPNVQSPIDIRIKAYSGVIAVNSNTISYFLTSYGCLGQYAVGAGIPSADWNWNSPLSLICDDNVLTATPTFANGTFRFFTENGVWGSGRNYPYYIGEGYKINTSFEDAMDGDHNFKFTGTPGAYRLKIDGNKKTITAFQGTTAANSHWLVGAATPGGWSWAGNNETELGLITNGIYEVPLELKSGETFRVFLGNNGGDSWGEGSRNYPWYVSNGYTIDSELLNAGDGDSNFLYVGPTAKRIFRVDSVAKTVVVE